MLFQTDTFFLFFLIVLSLIALIRLRLLQIVVLLIASFVFYMSWNWYLIALILASTVIDYFAALAIDRSQRRSTRRGWLLCSLISNLGLLGFFKYYNFFVGSLNSALGFDIPHLDLILPVGISFYTFQTLSYTIDVYLGRHPPTRSFLEFALFVAYFPQLVAGPIVRSDQFLPQLQRPLFLDADNMRSGLHLFLVGLFKKVAIADNLSPFADRVFESPSGLPSALIVAATLCFGMQIYCDFSGYTDMARGASRILGIELPINFNHPYSAVSFSEFWRRWHITLSTWLRDYLYIPLGGNRKGEGRTYANLMLTMALGGLWHGAAWNFVIWGIYQGALLAVERVLERTIGLSDRWRRVGQSPLLAVLRWAIVQYFVFLGWLVFRVGNAGDLAYCVRKYVVFDGNLSVAHFGVGSGSPFVAMIMLAVGVLTHAASARIGGLANALDRLPVVLLIPVYLVTSFLLLLLWPTYAAPFIYFQF